MNILQIGTIDKSGGAALISWKIKKALERFGYKSPMFVSTKCSNDPDVFIIKKTVHRYLCFLFANDIDLFRTDWILKTKEFKDADIVHFHNLHGWFFNLKTLKKISKLKPIVWTLHDMWAITPHCAHAFDGKLKDGFYQCRSLNMYPRILWNNSKYLMWRKKYIYSNTNIDIVVPSLWLKGKVESSVLKDKNIHLIYNGVDASLFKKMDKKAARQKLGIPKDKKLILFVSDGGKDNQYKGWIYVEKILEKYQERPDIHFICIGGTADSSKSQNANITYVPKIKQPELLALYYSSVDIFLYPSLADSFGLVVAESLSCGTPVLTFETGGIPEIVVHRRNGYIAKYRDTNDLIEGMEYLLKLSEHEMDLMSQNAIEKIKNNFTEKMMIDNYLNLYKSLLKKNE